MAVIGALLGLASVGGFIGATVFLLRRLGASELATALIFVAGAFFVFTAVASAAVLLLS